MDFSSQPLCWCEASAKSQAADNVINKVLGAVLPKLRVSRRKNYHQSFK
jgi:hypothetical protein